MCPRQPVQNSDPSSRTKLIKGFVQKICTPITAAKRLKFINQFFQRYPAIPFDHHDYLYICKGLFYAVWYSEMNKGCDEIIETIASNCGKNDALAVAMFEALAIEWIGIDTYRVDKFLYLIRRILRCMLDVQYQSFTQSKSFNSSLVEEIIGKTEKLYGLVAHLVWVMSQELVNVIVEKGIQNCIKTFILKQLLPFLNLMARSDDVRLFDSVKRNLIFDLFISLTKSDCLKSPVKFRQQLSEFLMVFSESPSISRKQRHAFTSSIALLHSQEELNLVLQEEAIASRFAKRKANPRHPSKVKRRRVR